MNFPKPTKEKYLLALATLFAIISISHLALDIYEGVPESFLWFCINIMIILSLGLYYKNSLLISSALVSSFIIEILWSLDLISFAINGSLIIGITNYFSEISTLRFILTQYHLLLLIIPIFVIFKTKQFHKKAWILSSIHLLAVFVLTLLLRITGVNCIEGLCNVGIFSFIYALKPAFMPFFIFHWIALTLILFIPIQILFNYLITLRNKPRAQ